MKILHSADWHLDSPITGRSEAQAQYLRRELLKIPDKVATVCKNEQCDILLLAGDIFDGAHTAESLHAVRSALKELSIPIFITPGNHDFCRPDSPWLTETWPENVHIFTKPVIESVTLPKLGCKVYGAGYTAMDCPSLLKGFHAEGDEHWHIGVLHADATQANSPYCSVTNLQVKESALDYLALGHIHKAGSFRAGDVLCAWPGNPMGRAFDEPDQKGVLIVTLDENVQARFLPLNTPRFYDLTTDAGADPAETAADLLPPVDTQDFYRITFTGYAAPMDPEAIAARFPHIPNLELRDRTLPEVDLWSCIHEDTLEGVFFRTLHDGLNTDSEKLQQNLKLAAKIARQILDGQEVTLP